MACNNSLNKNHQPDKTQKSSTNIYFDNISEKLSEQNWWYKNIKYRQNMFAQEEHIIATACQIDIWKKLLAEIKNDSGRVVSMILDMQRIYTKNLDKANKINNKCNEICTYILELE